MSTTATATKSSPILFSGPMVRAILDGRKTQTRRVVKPQLVRLETPRGRNKAAAGWLNFRALPCPYGQPGDELWVREAFGVVRFVGVHDGDIHESKVVYSADEPKQKPLRWTPSIHMPRCASRITLTVKAVRVERLQDISEADAIAEGVEPNWIGDLNPPGGMAWDANEHGWNPYDGDESQEGFPAVTAKESFRGLWQSINGPGSWDANPWVWVIEFERKQS